MCSRNVKRPATWARPARAAGCRLKGARSVASTPPPAPRRGGHEPRQQRVTRRGRTGTSSQANEASRPCADRTGRTHRFRHDGTDQGIRPCTGTPAGGLAAVARHPLDVRAVTDRGVSEAAGAIDRAVAADRALGAGDVGRIGSVQASPAPRGAQRPGTGLASRAAEKPLQGRQAGETTS